MVFINNFLYGTVLLLNILYSTYSYAALINKIDEQDDLEISNIIARTDYLSRLSAASQKSRPSSRVFTPADLLELAGGGGDASTSISRSSPRVRTPAEWFVESTNSREYASTPMPVVKSAVQCAICLDQVKEEESQVTGHEFFQCSPDHIFHKNCIEKWLKYTPGGGCPLCRSGRKKIEETDGQEDIDLGSISQIFSTLSRENLLSLSVELNQESFVRTLLEHGANPNRLDQYNQTPLLVAIANKNEPLISLLLEYGATYVAESINPLIVAAQHFYTEQEMPIIRLIADKIPNIINKATNDWYPIAIAALLGNIEAVKLFCLLGADINVVTDVNLTPLALAAIRGHVPVVKFLLSQGADQTIEDSNGWDALARAAQNGHAQVVEAILNVT
jgi:hypothetical protein